MHIFYSIFKNVLIVLITIFIFGCSFLGTKTIYKTNNTFNINKIGYCNPVNINIIEDVCPTGLSIFNSSFKNEFSKYNIESTYINIDLSIENIDTNKIRGLCEFYNFDGFIIPIVGIIRARYSYYGIPVAQNIDTKVELYLFDNKGNLLLIVYHDTYKGNSYFFIPNTFQTIKDGVIGAIKRIVKEIN